MGSVMGVLAGVGEHTLVRPDVTHPMYGCLFLFCVVFVKNLTVTAHQDHMAARLCFPFFLCTWALYRVNVSHFRTRGLRTVKGSDDGAGVLAECDSRLKYLNARSAPLDKRIGSLRDHQVGVLLCNYW